MQPAKRRARRPVAAIVAAVLLAAVLVRCIRRDELHCENAVARLQECCSGFAVDSYYCAYADSGCGVTYPTISEHESSCVVHASCTDLVERGTCALAQTAMPRHEDGVEIGLCR